MQDDDRRRIWPPDAAETDPFEHDSSAEDDLTLEEWRDALAVLALLTLEDDEDALSDSVAWIH